MEALIPTMQLQENQNAGGNGWDNFLTDRDGSTATYVVSEEGTYTVSYDISSLTTTDVYMLKFQLGETGVAEGNIPDLKPGLDIDTTAEPLLCGNTQYSLKATADGSLSWGLITLYTKDVAAKELTKTGHSVEEIDGKIYLVLEGTYANYTEEEILAMTPGFDLQQNQLAGAASWDRVMQSDNNEAGTPIIEAKDGVWKVKYDITDVADSKYTIHFSLTGERYPESDTNGNANKIIAFNYDTAKDETITIGNKQIRLISAPGEYSDATKYWSNAAIEITTVAEEPVTE